MDKAVTLVSGAIKHAMDFCGLMYQHQLYVGLGLLGIFVWEHCARVHRSQFRPTVGINYATIQLRYGFETVGTFIAKVSSFLTQLDFRELKKTTSDLIESIFKFSTAFMYILKGYFETAQQYVGARGLVYLGSFLIVIGLYVGFRYYQTGTLTLFE